MNVIHTLRRTIGRTVVVGSIAAAAVAVAPAGAALAAGGCTVGLYGSNGAAMWCTSMPSSWSSYRVFAICKSNRGLPTATVYGPFKTAPNKSIATCSSSFTISGYGMDPVYK